MTDRPEDAATAVDVVFDALLDGLAETTCYGDSRAHTPSPAPLLPVAEAVLVALSEQGYSVKKLEQVGTARLTAEGMTVFSAYHGNDGVPVFREV